MILASNMLWSLLVWGSAQKPFYSGWYKHSHPPLKKCRFLFPKSHKSACPLLILSASVEKNNNRSSLFPCFNQIRDSSCRRSATAANLFLRGKRSVFLRSSPWETIQLFRNVNVGIFFIGKHLSPQINLNQLYISQSSSSDTIDLRSIHN